MRPEEAAAAAAVGRIALDELYPEVLTDAERAVRERWAVARAAHLQRTDPDGCWVAEVDGQVVGVALGLIRDGVWGFSLFGLNPAFQGQGIGGPLYARALAYANEAPDGGIIMSSSHPAAMRTYARSPGFRLLPAVSLSGVCRRDRGPGTARCRPGDPVADAASIDAASRGVRGASHRRDLPLLLDRPEVSLLVLDGDGFVVVRRGSPLLLAATSPDAAEELLWGAMLSGTEGGTLEFGPVTAENQWAIRAGLEAGLTLAPAGPIFVRGRPGPLAPFLLSGAFL